MRLLTKISVHSKNIHKKAIAARSAAMAFCNFRVKEVMDDAIHKTYFGAFFCVTILFTLAACSLTTPSGNVSIQVLDESGQLASAVTVYAGNYPDERDPWSPEAGVTDEHLYSGEIEVGRKDIREGTVLTIVI